MFQVLDLGLADSCQVSSFVADVETAITALEYQYSDTVMITVLFETVLKRPV